LDNSSGQSSENLAGFHPDMLGRARGWDGGQNVRMVWENAAAFNTALCGRVRQLREAGGWTQEQMAEALGIPADRYRKYETRSPMPAYLIQRFASIVGRHIEFVLTGKDPARRKRGNPHAAGKATRMGVGT